MNYQSALRSALVIILVGSSDIALAGNCYPGCPPCGEVIGGAPSLQGPFYGLNPSLEAGVVLAADTDYGPPPPYSHPYYSGYPDYHPCGIGPNPPCRYR